MSDIVMAVAVVAVLVWLLSGRRKARQRAPEDDPTTAVDHAELAEAERELADDPRPRPLDDGAEGDEDDWGPGTTR